MGSLKRFSNFTHLSVVVAIAGAGFGVGSAGCNPPVANCPPLPAILNTGWDQTTQSELASWTYDDEWTGFSPVYNGGASVPAAVAHAVLNDTHVGMIPTLPDSRWIQAYNNVNIQPYHYEFEFCLNSGFTNPLLELQFKARDEAAIYLNGQLLLGPAGSLTTTTSYSTSDPAYFQPGMNTLTVIVSNTRYLSAHLSLTGTVNADFPLPEPDLEILKTLSGRLTTGHTADYEFKVHNIGADAASAPITLIDTIPQGFTYQGFSAPSGGWSCSSTAVEVQCDYAGPALQPGDQAPPLVITFEIGPHSAFPPGTELVENCASISHPHDIDLSNNESCTIDKLY